MRDIEGWAVTVKSVDTLTVGQEFWIQERGEMVGPFTVHQTTGARTEEHIIGRSRSGLFEQYVPYTVFVEGAQP